MSLCRKQRFLVAMALVMPLLCIGPGERVAEVKRHPADSAATLAGASQGIEIAEAELARRTANRHSSAKQVKVQAGASAWSFETRAVTVGEFLGGQGILVGPLDAVSPDPEVPIEDGLVVTISRIERDFEMEETTMAAGIVWQGDPNLPLDQIQTRTVGKPGRTATRSRIVHRAGQAPDRDLVESWTLQAAVDTVLVFGQKIVRSTFTTFDGQSLSYWRKTRMLATSYSAANAGTAKDDPWYGYTFSGEPMGSGVVAADLDVVPLRTRLYIPGYGYGNVLDTGGGISGLHIDLGYEDDAYVSWYRMVDVYWLWPPPSDSSEIAWMLPPAPTQN